MKTLLRKFLWLSIFLLPLHSVCSSADHFSIKTTLFEQKSLFIGWNLHLGGVISSFLSTLTQLVTIKSRKISFKKITFDERNSKQTTLTGRLRESPSFFDWIYFYWLLICRSCFKNHFNFISPNQEIIDLGLIPLISNNSPAITYFKVRIIRIVKHCFKMQFNILNHNFFKYWLSYSTYNNWFSFSIF